ncbi:MAG: TlpA disulfide reductase family protein [Anaerolineaceae bacterium]
MSRNNPETKRLQAKVNRHKREWLSRLLIGSGVVLLAAMLIVLFSRPKDSQIVPVRMGQPLSDFTLSNLDGNPVRLSDYAGRPVIVNAWAEWCPPCRAEMPALNDYYRQHSGDDLVVLAVNAGDSQAVAAKFVNSAGLEFPVVLDSTGEVLNAFGIYSFPTSIFVGRDGRVKAIHIGMFTPETLEQEFTPLLIQE